MKKLLKPTIIVALALVCVYFLIDTTGYNPTDLKEEIEVLHKENDSLETQIVYKDEHINEITQRDLELTEELQKAKEDVKVVKVQVEREVEVVRTYDSLAIVKFFASRYPLAHEAKDTLISINKPVLVSSAADLVRYDGAKQVITLQDSIVKIQDQKLVLKDSVIDIMYSKERDYKLWILNKDREIVRWVDQNKSLNKENSRLKRKTKLVKVLTFGLIGTVSFLILTK